MNPAPLVLLERVCPQHRRWLARCPVCTAGHLQRQRVAS